MAEMNDWGDLKADTHREYGRFSWWVVVMGALKCRTFRVVVTMRLCQAAARGRFSGLALFFYRKMHRITSNWAAMDFPWETEIGAGFAIHHGWGLVVSKGARIGRNVTLFHGVTIGRRDRISPDGERRIGCPVIEDQVWVGPNTIIVGDVTIGRGSRIAGGAVVMKSVPPHSVVMGNPARVVTSNSAPDVVNPVRFEHQGL